MKVLAYAHMGKKNPLVEYKFEAYDMFQEMIQAIQQDTVMYLYRIRVQFENTLAPENEDHLQTAHMEHEEVLDS